MYQVDLRGDTRKREFLEKHEVSPLLAAKVPRVRGISGCCGPVSDEFHFFKVNRAGQDDVEFIVMGPGCAKSLYALMETSALKVFSPTVAFQEGQDVPSVYHQLCPFNRELHDAIWLLCIAWRTVPTNHFLKIIDEIYSRPYEPVPVSYGRAFFNVLSKDRRGRDLVKLMADLRKSYPKLRWFRFDNLKSIEPPRPQPMRGELTRTG